MEELILEPGLKVLRAIEAFKRTNLEDLTTLSQDLATLSEVKLTLWKIKFKDNFIMN